MWVDTLASSLIALNQNYKNSQELLSNKIVQMRTMEDNYKSKSLLYFNLYSLF